jgi:hypothetical protein
MEQIYEFSMPKIFGATYKLPCWQRSLFVLGSKGEETSA